MSVFIALCLALIAVALAFLLTPLLTRRALPRTETPTTVRNATVYREQLTELDTELKRGAIDQAQWTASRRAIERRALDEADQDDSPKAEVANVVADVDAPAAQPRRATLIAAILGISVPVAAIAIYVLLGTPQAIFPEAGNALQQAMTAEQLEAMIAKLANRMKTNPGDTEGWIMLGRSYATMGRFQEAAGAYAKAAEQRPGDAQLLADYADTLGMANGRSLKGEPEALIARALKADKNNIKVLTLAGTVAYQNGDFRKAIALWQAILPQVPADDPFAKSVNGIISDAQAQAQALLGEKSEGKNTTPQAKGGAAGGAVPAEAALLQGTVSLSPALRAKTNPDDTVFIYARAASGPRMPLAIMRSTVKALPLQFSLDDASAMSPAMKLSAFDQVVVVARISKSGTAAPQKGDLEGVTAAMAPRARGIKLEIGSAVE